MGLDILAGDGSMENSPLCARSEARSERRISTWAWSISALRLAAMTKENQPEAEKAFQKAFADALALEQAAAERLITPSMPTMDSTTVVRKNTSQPVPFGKCIPRIKRFD